MPSFSELDIAMIEQPLPRGGDDVLADYHSPIPLCADESCQHRGELDEVAERYQVLNIKLDKTGGLTEALLLADAAKAKGLSLMVGNMGGTSLAMAPGFVVAQHCRYADLDGPLFLKHDRHQGFEYRQGLMQPLYGTLWG